MLLSVLHEIRGLLISEVLLCKLLGMQYLVREIISGADISGATIIDGTIIGGTVIGGTVLTDSIPPSTLFPSSAGQLHGHSRFHSLLTQLEDTSPTQTASSQVSASSNVSETSQNALPPSQPSPSLTPSTQSLSSTTSSSSTGVAQSNDPNTHSGAGNFRPHLGQSSSNVLIVGLVAGPSTAVFIFAIFLFWRWRNRRIRNVEGQGIADETQPEIMTELHFTTRSSGEFSASEPRTSLSSKHTVDEDIVSRNGLNDRAAEEMRTNMHGNHLPYAYTPSTDGKRAVPTINAEEEGVADSYALPSRTSQRIYLPDRTRESIQESTRSGASGTSSTTRWSSADLQLQRSIFPGLEYSQRQRTQSLYSSSTSRQVIYPESNVDSETLPAYSPRHSDSKRPDYQPPKY